MSCWPALLTADFNPGLTLKDAEKKFIIKTDTVKKLDSKKYATANLEVPRNESKKSIQWYYRNKSVKGHKYLALYLCQKVILSAQYRLKQYLQAV